MKRRVLFFLLFLLVGLAPWGPIVSAAPPGIIRSPLSVLIKWIWGPPAPTSKPGLHLPEFSSVRERLHGRDSSGRKQAWN